MGRGWVCRSLRESLPWGRMNLGLQHSHPPCCIPGSGRGKPPPSLKPQAGTQTVPRRDSTGATSCVTMAFVFPFHPNNEVYSEP